VLRKEAAQRGDPAANLDEVVEHPAAALVTERPVVQLLDIVLDPIDRPVIARHGDVQQRGEERLRVEQPIGGIRLDLVIEIVEEGDRLVVRGDDRVGRRDDGEPRRVARLRRVRLGDDPDVEVGAMDRQGGPSLGGTERLGGAGVQTEEIGKPRDKLVGHRPLDVDPQQLPLRGWRRQGLVEVEHLVGAVRIEAPDTHPGAVDLFDPVVGIVCAGVSAGGQ